MASVHDFNPFSKETIGCPYPFYQAMREQSPVHEASPGVFFITTYDLVSQVLRDTVNFSSQNGAAFLNFQGEAGLGPPSAPPPAVRELLRHDIPNRNTLLSADPPEHTRYRSLVNRSLSPGRLARYEAVVRGVVTQLIDDFIDRGEAEFVSEFSMLLPLHVVSIALGVPQEDLPKYKDWSVRSVTLLARKATPEELIDGIKAGIDLRRYIADRVEEARKRPEDNVIGNLVNAHMLESDDGDVKQYRPLDTPEIVSIVQQLLVAGQETVNYLVSSLLLKLIEKPAQMRDVRNNPDKIKQLIEEGVGIESPIQSLGRFAKNDVEVGGVKIPAGSRIVVMYGCANRDENKFANADQLDTGRENLRDHVGFGVGPHYCVGAALARLETRVAFEELFKRLKNIRLAEDKNDFEYMYSFIFRALNALHIKFDKADDPDNRQDEK
jgi:cytochrome P450